MREAKSIKHFKSTLVQFFTLFSRFFQYMTKFSIHDQIGVNLLTKLRLKFSHLSNLKFRRKFKACLRPMCNCGTEIETTKHFF